MQPRFHILMVGFRERFLVLCIEALQCSCVAGCQNIFRNLRTYKPDGPVLAAFRISDALVGKGKWVRLLCFFGIRHENNLRDVCCVQYSTPCPTDVQQRNKKFDRSLSDSLQLPVDLVIAGQLTLIEADGEIKLLHHRLTSVDDAA